MPYGLRESPQIVTWFNEVDALTDSPWLLEGLIPADSLVVLSGEPKISWKSWLAFLIAMVIATGKRYGELKPTGAYPVLVHEAEAPSRSTRERFTLLERGTGMYMETTTPLYFHHMGGLLLDDGSHIADVIAFIKEKGIKLLIVDTLAKSGRFNENNSSEMAVALRNCDRIRAAGCTVLLIHHRKKFNSDDPHPDIDQALRGSSALAGAYDVHFGVVKSSPEQKHLDLLVRSKDFEEQQFSLTWRIDKDAQACMLTMERHGADGLPGHLIDKVHRELLPSQPYNNVKIKRIAGNVSNDTVDRLIAFFVSERILTEEKPGVYYMAL